MNSSGSENVREYYRRITEVDIGDVAREMLGSRIARETPSEIEADCPRHQSQSGRSLQVFIDKQGWCCHGCGVGGDVLQLVEFLRSGTVTRGQSGPMPESHRAARDFLAERVGLPPLAEYGLAPDRLAETEAARALELRTQGALTALARHYHARLRDSPHVLEWLRSKYAISDETIDRLLVGFADNGPAAGPDRTNHAGPVSALTAGPESFTLRELAGTGAFRPTAQDGLHPFFERRVIFPYWSRGRVVFLIGRKTPWTPDEPWQQGKYQKLPTHNEHNHAHVAPCVSNSHLYNEDCLIGRPDRVVITEGVTDCVALLERGFAAVSPVTVQIKSGDWERLLPKLAGVKTVFLCHDNELSQAGLQGALRTAGTLAEHGIDTRIVVLPLDEKQREARRQLLERFGLGADVDGKDLRKRLASRASDEIEEAEGLLADAKIDVNEYFASGHSAEDFEALIREALAPLEHGVLAIPTEIVPEERNRRLEPILKEVSRRSPLEQGRCLDLIRDHFGRKDIPLTELRRQVQALGREARAEAKAEARERRLRERRISDAPQGSCRATVEKALLDSEAESGAPDYAMAAEAAFEWLRANGGHFFRTRQDELFLLFGSALFWMDSRDPGKRRAYSSLIYEQTGIVSTTPSGKTFVETLANRAYQYGEVRDSASWVHTDVAGKIVYFNLNNDDHEIVRISPEGIDVLKNGNNPERVFVQPSSKCLPIRFLKDADVDEADRLLRSLVIENLSCAPADALLVLSWLSAFLLVDFAGTRPLTRFEGNQSSGKSTAAKLLSMLVYGQEAQKHGTVAANYSDGTRNPFIFEDNVETRDATTDFRQFLLMCATGITRDKRKGGTDSDTVDERPKCLINTTGVEPLGGELTELLSRSFVVKFDHSWKKEGGIVEVEAKQRILERRDFILSALMKKTSHVLALLRDGGQQRAMQILFEALGDHDKSRTNDYLAMMYLMTLAGGEGEATAPLLEALHPQFAGQVESLNRVTQETARDSNAIATVLGALFGAYGVAVDADREESGLFAAPRKSRFLESYQVRFAEKNRIEGILARELFVAMKRFSKDSGLRFPIDTPAQFAQRFANDRETIRQAGFDIRINELPNRVRSYDIEAVGPK